MIKTAKKTAKKAVKKTASNRILDDMLISVKSKKNPFTEGTVQFKHANAVLNAKTVAEAKKKGADSWTVRELATRGLIAVKKAA